jgi:CubicO group peptidase (beta-lactamase class C family)
MRSGLEWEENGPLTWRWLAADDQLAFTLNEQTRVHEPGSTWVYSTADSHLLGACLAHASGRSLLAYADRVLLEPLGIRSRRWTRDGAGRCIGGSELFLRPRDMARIGQLCLQQGLWRGQRLIPNGWLELITAPQPGLTGLALRMRPDAPVSPYRPGFGHCWWTGRVAGHEMFFARGHGGQGIFVLPSLDCVVATVADTGRQDTFDDPDPEMRVLETRLIPALT